jgi:hypothetical protein
VEQDDQKECGNRLEQQPTQRAEHLVHWVSIGNSHGVHDTSRTINLAHAPRGGQPAMSEKCIDEKTAFTCFPSQSGRTCGPPFACASPATTSAASIAACGSRGCRHPPPELWPFTAAPPRYDRSPRCT